ncbi:MAG: 1,4-alpha-glucan branching enzyme [Solirubrobacteraceae bacterium]|nr:1,4-alpha-glucan branching enzyme [Solirubrobacteraceae bacterium]
MSGAGGRLAIVLHTHMPYVEGFDTWPFGEEWLWEAIATSYLPVLDVLEQTGAPITVSLTPVLCDQLAAPGALDRCLTFLRELRPESHRIDLAEQPPELRPALALSAADYERAAQRLQGMDLLAAFAPYAAWTSSATHAVLPLVATDAGARLQVVTGIESHRARFGAWRGGFWLPECAHAGWLDGLLEEAGVHATCVDLTDVLGLGTPAQLAPLRSEAGLTLVPLDRQTIELVWSDHGYPADGAYRDYHHRTRMDHRPWAVDGTPYDADRAAALAREHAADFVARALVRSREAPDALVVCAIDTELLGHWWYEGPQWLRAVVEECERQELRLVALDDALEEVTPQAAPAELPTTTWGSPRDLSTWDGPGVEAFAWRARRAELELVAAGRSATPRAVRELLALQASDWAFLVGRELAAAYGHARAEGHHDRLAAELASLGSSPPELRNLAPFATVAPLLT